MIDAKQQLELRHLFNPDGSELRSIQMQMLDMLVYIDNICKQNNIPYWLSSGTCLGAVRHGGFIPWDDDVDIEMLQTDYDKLTTILTENKNNSPYILQTYKNDKSYFPRFGKLRNIHTRVKETYSTDHKHKYNGIFIDIFPLRKSSSKFIHKLGYYPLLFVSFGLPKLYFNSRVMSISQSFGQFTISSLGLILNGLQYIGKKKYLRHVSPNYFSFPRVENEIFPLKRIKFENVDLPVPNDTNSYLQRLYGTNYMNLPPLTSIKKHLLQISII